MCDHLPSVQLNTTHGAPGSLSLLAVQVGTNTTRKSVSIPAEVLCHPTEIQKPTEKKAASLSISFISVGFMSIIWSHNAWATLVQGSQVLGSGAWQQPQPSSQLGGAVIDCQQSLNGTTEKKEPRGEETDPWESSEQVQHVLRMAMEAVFSPQEVPDPPLGRDSWIPSPRWAPGTAVTQSLFSWWRNSTETCHVQRNQRTFGEELQPFLWVKIQTRPHRRYRALRKKSCGRFTPKVKSKLRLKLS